MNYELQLSSSHFEEYQDFVQEPRESVSGLSELDDGVFS